ncbi:MAG: EAL domain-containing protein, partial [Demequinaceae bacterium]|nr:EAL domain-containing protein [Demequinaceae bacterium]
MYGAPVIMIARAFAKGGDRAVWLSLGSAMLLSATGEAIYALEVAGLDPEPFPSIADVPYLAYYPFAIAAALVFVRRRAHGVPRAVWWDGAVLALAVGGFVGAVFLAPLTGTLTGGTEAVLVGAAYPIGDTVILLIAALGVTLVGVRRAHALLWIALAMAVAALADLRYWNLLAANSYVEGTWLDALWPLSSILLAMGAWVQGSQRSEAVASSRGLLVVPGVSLLAATATLAFGTVKPIPILTVALAIAALLGVLSRLNATVRQTMIMMDALRDANTDDLTGLANRRGFARATAALLEGGGRDRGVVLLVADLDGFKEINSSIGYSAGDDVLRSIAARFAAEVAPHGGALGRLGGDEFSVLLPDADIDSGLALAARLRTALALPFEVASTSFSMTASMGIAVGPEDGADMASLLKRADIAMRRAKSEHLAEAVFDPRVDLSGEDRLKLINELRNGIRDGELVLHYQPKIALASGRVEAVEALVRWDRPTLGLVFPDEFLPLVRSASLLQPLTESVLMKVATQSALWRAGGTELPIAVNLPAEALTHEALPSYLEALLCDHNLPGEALQVEITEEALLKDPNRAELILRGLRRLGVKVAIDDYGTGYSSLVYLRDLVVDEVK